MKLVLVESITQKELLLPRPDLSNAAVLIDPEEVQEQVHGRRDLGSFANHLEGG